MSQEFEFLLAEIESRRTDGIEECEDIIKANHGTIEKLVITVSKEVWYNVEIVREAVDYLVNDWQYNLNNLRE